LSASSATVPQCTSLRLAARASRREEYHMSPCCAETWGALHADTLSMEHRPSEPRGARAGQRERCEMRGEHAGDAQRATRAPAGRAADGAGVRPGPAPSRGTFLEAARGDSWRRQGQSRRTGDVIAACLRTVAYVEGHMGRRAMRKGVTER